jgi:hypothetical protein
MANKRLNDTAAVASMPVFPSGNSSRSESIRKVDGGYIHTTSSCVDGNYEHKESVHHDQPNPSPDQNSMARAKAYLNKK